MSKNKKHRNFSYNNNNGNNVNASNVIEDMESSENEVEEGFEDVEESEDNVTAVVEETTESVETTEVIDEVVVPEVVEMKVSYEPPVVEVEKQVVIDSKPVFNNTLKSKYVVASDADYINHESSVHVDDLDEAQHIAIDMTRSTGYIHHVWDSDYRLVFSAKKKYTLFAKKGRNRNADWYS